mmetsp:Transcript_105382/g.235188  ORF Transcript_105382/g.235188 Transcript_105382/m.235188 type:complete len:234 (-) Transcript_105382:816-1517(-)
MPLQSAAYCTNFERKPLYSPLSSFFSPAFLLRAPCWCRTTPPCAKPVRARLGNTDKGSGTACNLRRPGTGVRGTACRTIGAFPGVVRFTTLLLLVMSSVALPIVALPFVALPIVALLFGALPFVALPFLEMPFRALPWVALPFTAVTGAAPWTFGVTVPLGAFWETMGGERPVISTAFGACAPSCTGGRAAVSVSVGRLGATSSFTPSCGVRLSSAPPRPVITSKLTRAVAAA